MKNTTQTVVVLAIFFSLAAWLAWRFFVIVPLAASETLSQLNPNAVAEMKEYMQPRYRFVIQTYLRDLNLYETLRFQPIESTSNPAEIANKIMPVIEDKLNQDGVSNSILKTQDKALVQQLADKLGILLVRCAGMQADKYLKLLGPNYVLTLPRNIEALRLFCQLLPGVAIPSDSGNQEVMWKFFNQVYSVAQNFRKGTDRFVAWSDDKNGGVYAVIDSVTPEDAFNYIEQTDSRFSLEDRIYFKGSLTTGSLVFAEPKDRLITTEPSTSVLRAQVFFIVQTQGNDFFPICFHLYYDRSWSQWCLLYVNCHVSPRMATSPMRAF